MTLDPWDIAPNTVLMIVTVNGSSCMLKAVRRLREVLEEQQEMLPEVGRALLYRLSLVDAHTVAQN